MDIIAHEKFLTTKCFQTMVVTGYILHIYVAMLSFYFDTSVIFKVGKMNYTFCITRVDFLLWNTHTINLECSRKHLYTDSQTMLKFDSYMYCIVPVYIDHVWPKNVVNKMWATNLNGFSVNQSQKFNHLITVLRDRCTVKIISTKKTTILL